MQIFNTPEGQLSSEQGIYVAETVTAKNTKLAKGRFRVYDDPDGLVNLYTFYFSVVMHAMIFNYGYSFLMLFVG